MIGYYTAPSMSLPTPPVISISSMWATYGWATMGESQAAPAVATSPAANEALFFPFVVTTTATFTRGFWFNGSAVGGNVCVGIYDEAQNRLATTGAVAQAGLSVVQQAAFSANATLNSGVYYMAISFSAATASGVTAYTASLSRGRECGAYRQATGVHPLPNPAVFATWTSLVVPVFGVATTSFAI